MPFIKANGIEFYYEMHGESHPLICIGGFTNHSGIWKEYLPELAKKFQVLLFDPRGSGKTKASPPPDTIDLFADDLIGLMDALQMPLASMIGFSMGTLIIQSLALRYPKRIKKAVLLSPFNKIPKTALMQLKVTAKLLRGGIPPNLVAANSLPWLYGETFLHQPNQVDKIITDLMSDPYPPSQESYQGGLSALSHFDITEKLHMIQTEMLLLSGECDLFTPLSTAMELKKNLQNATLHILKNAGHMTLIESREEILRIICPFYK